MLSGNSQTPRHLIGRPRKWIDGALSEGTGDPASPSGSNSRRGIGVEVSHLRSDPIGCTDDLVDP